MKKYISVVLSLVLLLSFCASFTASAKSADEERLYIDLGILPEKKTTGLIQPTLNREKFADILVKMQNLSGLTEVVNLAGDIEKSKLKNEINHCISYGYLKTDEDGNFRPNGAITYADSIRAVMTVLGYDTLIEDKANDSAYLAMAGKIGLLKGVSVLNPEKLSYDELYAIVVNAMKTKIPQYDFIDENYTETLYDRLSVSEHSGKILANSTYSTGVDKPSKNHVNIGGEVYAANVEIPNELVGLVVTYYMKDDVLVSVSPSSKITKLTLSPSDILAVRDRGRELVLECTGDEEIEIEKSALAIVNNKAIPPSKTMFDCFKSGSLTLIDSENSGSYDVIHMDIARNIVVSSISEKSYSLLGKYSDEAVKLAEIKDEAEVYVNGKAASLGDIKIGQSVSVICDSFSFKNGEIVFDYDKAEYVKLLASNAGFEGMIEQIDGDGYIYIDDMDYKLSYYLEKLMEKGLKEKVRAGDYVKVLLDSFSVITDIEVDKQKSFYEYGYLVAADLNTERIDHKLKMRILNSKGKVVEYQVGEKLVVDGKTFKDKALTYDVGTGTDVDLSKRQVILFRANEEGILKSIDTLQKSNAEDDNSLKAALDFDPYQTGLSKFVIRSRIVNKQTAFGSNCVIFVDSAGLAANNPEDQYFSVRKASTMTGSLSYYMNLYNPDDFGAAECAVIWEGYDPKGPVEESSVRKQSLEYQQNSQVVESVVKAVSKDGKEVYKLTVADHGGKKQFFTTDIDFLSFYSAGDINTSWILVQNGGQRTYTEGVDIYRQDATKLLDILKSGDIIRYTLDGDGNANYIEKIVSFEEIKDGIVEITGTPGTNMLFANLEKASTEIFKYSYKKLADNPDAKSYIFNTLSRGAVVVYDVQKKTTEVMTDFTKIPTCAAGDNVKVWMRDYDGGATREYFVYVY